ncbi:hypothetical protein ACHAQJ_007069 [Trichoderma viride]
MPITELVFPSYKLDPQSLATLKENQQQLFGTFAGVAGLLKLFRGPILEDSGKAVDPREVRSVLALEWDDASSFHNFFPQSENFQNFVKIIKPLVAAPAIPELYEAEEQSTQCLSSNITQIIKVQSNAGTNENWKQLKESLGESVGDVPVFYHANGIEKDQDVFLGLIGWKNLQQYEQLGKNSSILEQIKNLNNEKEAQNIVVQLSPVDVAESKI